VARTVDGPGTQQGKVVLDTQIRPEDPQRVFHGNHLHGGLAGLEAFDRT